MSKKAPCDTYPIQRGIQRLWAQALLHTHHLGAHPYGPRLWRFDHGPRNVSESEVPEAEPLNTGMSRLCRAGAIPKGSDSYQNERMSTRNKNKTTHGEARHASLHQRMRTRNIIKIGQRKNATDHTKGKAGHVRLRLQEDWE